jgi:hypothetical protein
VRGVRRHQRYVRPHSHHYGRGVGVSMQHIASCARSILAAALAVTRSKQLGMAPLNFEVYWGHSVALCDVNQSYIHAGKVVQETSSRGGFAPAFQWAQHQDKYAHISNMCAWHTGSCVAQANGTRGGNLVKLAGRGAARPGGGRTRTLKGSVMLQRCLDSA